MSVANAIGSVDAVPLALQAIGRVLSALGALMITWRAVDFEGLEVPVGTETGGGIDSVRKASGAVIGCGSAGGADEVA